MNLDTKIDHRKMWSASVIEKLTRKIFLRGLEMDEIAVKANKFGG